MQSAREQPTTSLQGAQLSWWSKELGPERLITLEVWLTKVGKQGSTPQSELWKRGSGGRLVTSLGNNSHQVGRICDCLPYKLLVSFQSKVEILLNFCFSVSCFGHSFIPSSRYKAMCTDYVGKSPRACWDTLQETALGTCCSQKLGPKPLTKGMKNRRKIRKIQSIKPTLTTRKIWSGTRTVCQMYESKPLGLGKSNNCHIQ